MHPLEYLQAGDQVRCTVSNSFHKKGEVAIVEKITDTGGHDKKVYLLGDKHPFCFPGDCKFFDKYYEVINTQPPYNNYSE